MRKFTATDPLLNLLPRVTSIGSLLSESHRHPQNPLRDPVICPSDGGGRFQGPRVQEGRPLGTAPPRKIPGKDPAQWPSGAHACLRWLRELTCPDSHVWLCSLTTPTLKKKRSRSAKAMLGAILGIPGHSRSNSRTCTHDPSHTKTKFSEQFSERLPELVGSQSFSPNSRRFSFF